jgi:hypothetical protein
MTTRAQGLCWFTKVLHKQLKQTPLTYHQRQTSKKSYFQRFAQKKFLVGPKFCITKFCSNRVTKSGVLQPVPLGRSRRETPGRATSSEPHDGEKKCAAIVFLQDVGPPPPPPPQVTSVS